MQLPLRSIEASGAELADLLAIRVPAWSSAKRRQRGICTSVSTGPMSINQRQRERCTEVHRPSSLQLTVVPLLRRFESAAVGRLVCRGECSCSALHLLFDSLTLCLHAALLRGAACTAAAAAGQQQRECSEINRPAQRFRCIDHKIQYTGAIQ
jgi:hypothetical protein